MALPISDGGSRQRAGFASDFGEGGVARFPTPEESADFYGRYTGNARRPRRGSPLTRRTRDVGRVDLCAAPAGDPPTEKVAEEMHVARSTAARWVAAARKRGFLGPALRGRAGERMEER